MTPDSTAKLNRLKRVLEDIDKYLGRALRDLVTDLTSDEQALLTNDNHQFRMSWHELGSIRRLLEITTSINLKFSAQAE